MDDHLHRIALRQRELREGMDRAAKIIAEQEKVISEGEAELADLDVTGRTLARLTGAQWPIASEAGATEEEEAGEATKPATLPSYPQMILSVLRDAGRPMEPREITDAVRAKFWPDVDGAKISNRTWRLNKDGKLEKIKGTSQYRLPRKSEAPDADPGKETSEASDHHTDTEATVLESRPREVGHDNMT